MARAHVGKRMRELCQVLGAGIMDTQDITDATGNHGACLAKTIKSCLALGVIERVGGAGNKSHPYRYRVKPNWAEIIELRPDKKVTHAAPRVESFADFHRRTQPQ